MIEHISPCSRKLPLKCYYMSCKRTTRGFKYYPNISATRLRYTLNFANISQHSEESRIEFEQLNMLQRASKTTLHVV